MATSPPTPAELAGKVRAWIIDNGARSWYLDSDQCHELLADLCALAAGVRWHTDDDAPTLKLPPVRDSIGPRRQPPALRELPPGSAELLHLIADALAAEENPDGPTL